jgi:ferredoxin-NADP reductase
MRGAIVPWRYRKYFYITAEQFFEAIHKALASARHDADLIVGCSFDEKTGFPQGIAIDSASISDSLLAHRVRDFQWVQ